MPRQTNLPTQSAKSMRRMAIGICVGLALLIGVLLGSLRIGVVLGLVAGAIISFTMLFLDVTREDAQ